jgi:hypothetical protein
MFPQRWLWDDGSLVAALLELPDGVPAELRVIRGTLLEPSFESSRLADNGRESKPARCDKARPMVGR